MVIPPDTLSTIPNGSRTDAVAAVVSEDGTLRVLVLHSDSGAGVAKVVGIVEEDSSDSEARVVVVAVGGDSSEVAETVGVAVRQDSSGSGVDKHSAESGADDDSLGTAVKEDFCGSEVGSISLVNGSLSSASVGDTVLARTATQKVRPENFMAWIIGIMGSVSVAEDGTEGNCVMWG
jgi:hypothetical protein